MKEFGRISEDIISFRYIYFVNVFHAFFWDKLLDFTLSPYIYDELVNYVIIDDIIFRNPKFMIDIDLTKVLLWKKKITWF